MAAQQPLRPLQAPAPLEDQARRRAEQVERLISRVLRAGLWASMALVICGAVLASLDRAGTAAELPALIGGAGARPPSWSWLRQDLLGLRGDALIVLGLLLLIATPVVRVAISLLAFARQRDRAFVLITGGVLALLVLSFLLGKAG
ncbi:MAG: DUF1634 domain-containing protein [Anaeromyxobacter sp.]